jgi:glycolate oxidase iron-sulfur subunit
VAYSRIEAAVERSRDREQLDEARTGYERDTFGVPAHVQAAAEAAGETSVRSGPQDIAVAAEGSGVAAVRGAGGGSAPLRLFPAFDAHNPPSEDLIDDCVHCGFCLPTCPTYLLWGEEMDSPRGRIHLMKAGNEGRLGMTDTFVRHFDQCLGCMACVTACPSGVQYNKLIEATRSQVERRYRRDPADKLFRRLVFTLFPYPFLLLYRASGLQVLVGRTGLLGLLPPRLRSMHDLMPRMTWKRLRLRVPGRVQPGGPARARVGLLTGCVQRVFFPQVNAATVRVLASEGCEVIAPRGQACCGALALHAGYEEQARQFARELIGVFEREGLEYVAVNAAGCGSTMKEYGHLLRGDPDYAERAARFSAGVRDITELLVELGPLATRHPVRARVAYHDACHLAHAQGIRREPRNLLEGIPGIELVPVTEADICCGSAGIYNLVEPKPAGELGERKARHILATGASVVASANPGCTLQIESHARRLGATLKVVHPVEILDRSLHPRRKDR